MVERAVQMEGRLFQAEGPTVVKALGCLMIMQACAPVSQSYL